MSLQKGDLLLLNGNDDATLAKWWCLLNRWEWPSEVPDPEAKDAPEPQRRGALMRGVESRIGTKACLREWNRERMSDEEFEEFWRTNRVPESVAERLASASCGDNGGSDGA